MPLLMDIIPEQNNYNVKIRLNMLINLQRKGIRKAFYNIGKSLQKESKRLINKKPKTGRIYLIRKAGRIIKHRASSAGQAPAVITGRLRKSVDFSVQGSENLVFGSKRSVMSVLSGAGIGFTFRGKKIGNIIYPKYLEQGTSKMLPRPFLISSIRNNYKNIQNYFSYEIKKELLS
jgi:HK97 gp10 family phage protein